MVSAPSRGVDQRKGSPVTWFVFKPDGVMVGPLTTDQILHAVHAGEIPPDSHVRPTDVEQWRPMSDVPELDADAAKTLVLDKSHKAALAERHGEKPGDLLRNVKTRLKSCASFLERSRNIRLALLGGVGAAVLVAALVWGGAARTKADPLYSPCIDEVLSRAEAGSFECGKFSLRTRGVEDGIDVTIEKVPAAGLAGAMPELVGALLPNLPPPADSKGRGCFERPAGDLVGPAVKVLTTYHAAAERVARCVRMGGERAAVFDLEDRQLAVRSEFDDETGEGRIRLTSPPGDPLDATWEDLPWEAGRGAEAIPSDDVASLDQTMRKEGWWPGDAAAFVEAAKFAQTELDEQTVAAVAAVARWLRHSKEWALSTRSMIYSQCIQARSELLAGKDPEASYRVMAGITPERASAIVEPIEPTESRREAFAARFDAAIGSAMHAECAVTMGCPLTKLDAYDRTVRKSLFEVGRDAADDARRLVCRREFQRALGESLSAARGRLVGTVQAPGPAHSGSVKDAVGGR